MRKNSDEKTTNKARIRSAINANSFNKSKLFRAIYECEITKLKRGETSTSLERLIARTILFASAHCLLSESKWIFFLINSIMTDNVAIKYCPVGFYIDIYELNDIFDPIKIGHPKRCFLEPVTMSAIINLHDSVKTGSKKMFNNQTYLFQTLFTFQNTEPLAKLGTLKIFCEAAADFSLENIYPSLPMYLASYAKGKVASFSTNPLSFSRFWSNKPSEKLHLQSLDEIDTESFWQENIEKSSGSDTNSNHSSESYHSTDATYSRLLSRCQSKVDGKVRLVVTQIESLERYIASLASASEIILAEWILDLLRKDRKVDTAKQYLSSIGKYWLQSLNGVSIHEMSEIEMTDFRDGINEMPGSGETNVQREATLNRLLKFSNENFNTVLPSLFDDLEKYPLPRNFVICEHDFQNLLNWIRSQYSRGTQRIDSLYICTLLMGRCGLRPSEVLSLLMTDVEPSEQLHIFIRPSRFGGIKTYSAKRKIPIHVLLKPNEFEFFKQYYEKRKTQRDMEMKNPLLLPPDISRNYTYSLSDFDNKISQKLTEICGQRVVTYNLRHTAMSNIQLAVLSAESWAVEYFSPYSVIEAREIKRYFTQSSDKDGCWNISGLAGHLDPSTTFGVYMHFTDVLLSEFI
jgi:integrase